MKTIARILTIVLLLSVSAFAVDEIIAWGYGRQLHDVLRAIQMMTGNPNEALVKAVVLIGLFTVTMRIAASGTPDFMAIGKFLVLAVFVVQMFWAQQREFVVRDKVNNFVSPAVLQIPPGIGYTFSFFSRLEDGIGEKFESSFSTPNSISYQKAGLGFMMAAHLGMDTATIADPLLTQTFNAYLDNCLLNSALMNNSDLSYLLQSKDLYNDLAINEAWLTPVYTVKGANPEMKQCVDAWSDIQTMLSNSQDQVVSQFANSFGQLSASDVTGKLGDVAKTLFNKTGTSAQAYINQMALLNMYNSGLQAVALATGGSMSNIAVASAVRDASTQQSWLHTGLQAKKTLPLQKAFLTIASTVLIMLMALYSVALADFSGVKQMFSLLVTFSLWTPLAISINYMTYSAIEAVTAGITANDLPSIISKVAISQETSGYLAFLGYAITLVTAMAFMLTTKSATGFVSAVTSAGMSASVLRTAETIGGQGTINTNSVGAGNRSYNNSSENSSSTYGRAVDQAFVQGVNTVEGGGGTTSHSNHLGTSVEKRDGFYNAQFKGEELTTASVDGFSAAVGRQGTKALSEASTKSEQILSQLSVARASQIAKSIHNKDEESATESVQKTYGVDKGTAQTIVQSVKEADAAAHKQATANVEKTSEQKAISGSTDASLSVGIGNSKGILSGEAGVKISGQQSTGTTIGKDTTQGTASEYSATYENAFQSNITKQIGEKNSFSHALGQTFTSTQTKDIGHTDTKTATENATYQEARAIQQSANQSLQNAVSFNTDHSTAVLKDIVNQSGLKTKDEQINLLNSLAEDIKANGGQNFQDLIASSQNKLFFQHGIDTDKLNSVASQLAGNGIVINAEKDRINNATHNTQSIVGAANDTAVDNSNVRRANDGGVSLKGETLPMPSGSNVFDNIANTNRQATEHFADNDKAINRAPFGAIGGAGKAFNDSLVSTAKGWADFMPIKPGTPEASQYVKDVANGGAISSTPFGSGGVEGMLGGNKPDKTVVIQNDGGRKLPDMKAVKDIRKENNEK